MERDEIIRLTKEDFKRSITKDFIIIQTIHSIDEISAMINKLCANLRERYGYYAPRASKIEDNDNFLKQLFLRKKEDLGIDFSKEDIDSIIEIANETINLKSLNNKQERYITILMKNTCPELLNAAGNLIGARLISLAGSLKHLAEITSSRIQVLGAEKAMFRHLRVKSKAPKFGVIFAHDSISKASEKGKAARKLASKISIAAKKDYFRKYL